MYTPNDVVARTVGLTTFEAFKIAISPVQVFVEYTPLPPPGFPFKGIAVPSHAEAGPKGDISAVGFVLR